MALAAWWPKLRPGGVLTGTNFDTARSALEAFLERSTAQPGSVVTLPLGCPGWFVAKQ